MTIPSPNQAPTTAEIKINLVEDSLYVFKISDFPFFDNDAGQTLKFVKFTATSDRGGFYLRGVKIKLNQEISVEDINSGALIFIPQKNTTGENSSQFIFAVSDGIEYSSSCSGSVYISPVEDAPILNSSTGKQILLVGKGNDFVIDTHHLNTDREVISLATHHYENDRGFYTIRMITSNTSEQFIPSLEVRLAYEFPNRELAIAILNDGKYLVANYEVRNDDTFAPLRLSKFNHDGTIDKSFGETGTRLIELTHSVYRSQVTLQADGKYLISTFGIPSKNSRFSTVELDRFNSDGSSDTSFHRFSAASLMSISSLIKVDASQEGAISTLPNGKILVLGRNYYTNEIVVVRLLTDGSLDKTFGTDGLAHLKTVDNNEHLVTIVTSKDGESFILSQYVPPYGDSAISVTKLNVNGDFDESFNKTGVLTLTNSDGGLNLGQVKNLVITNDLKLLISTNAFTQDFPNDYDGKKIVLIRLDQNGRFDSSFNNNGIVTFSFESQTNTPIHITEDQDGKTTVTGTADSDRSDKYAFFVRFNQDGSVDNSFARTKLTEGNLSQGVILDNHIWINDPEIYSRTGDQPSFTIRRASSANSEDIFFFPEQFTVESTPYNSLGGKIYSYDRLIATYTVNNGELKLVFDGYYIYPDILGIIRSIKYSNAQAGSERLITLRWSLDEGIKGQTSIGEVQTEVLVAAATNSVPTGRNLHDVLQPFSNHIFSLEEFNFRDRDTTDQFQGIRIISVPTHKGLFLNNREVKVGDFIASTDIANGLFRFRSLDMSAGAFKFVLSDGKAQSIPYDWTVLVQETIQLAPEKLSISGNYKHGELLKAELKTNDIGDPNSIDYQWYVNGFADSRLNTATMLPTSANLGAVVELVVRYQDLDGNQKTYKSVGSQPIQVGNDAPSGVPVFSGRGIVGETLEYLNGFYDGDGIENVNGIPILQFQWRADGKEIVGATTSKLYLTPDFSGKTITVDIRYSDLKGKSEFISGGMQHKINEVITFKPSDKALIAKSGDNLIIGSASDDTIIINQPLADFSIMKSGAEFLLIGKLSPQTNTNTLHILRDIEHIQFQNLSVNLTITAKAKQISTQQVNNIIELYIAFFNRAPDADGLSYWLDQHNKGQSILQIANSFYHAGTMYPDLTGFSKTMSHEDFINVVYKNTLGRQNGADQEGMTYWSGQLKSGNATYASLVSEILHSAHSFKGDSTWGWVADLLDNKVSVGSRVAVDWGISFNSAEESIRKGMEIIAAVTPTNSWEAIKLIGLGTDAIYLQ